MVDIDVKFEQAMSPSSEQRRFQCHKCPRHFAQYCSLFRHQKYECGKKPRFKCPYCKFVTKLAATTYKHVRSKHPGQECYSVDLQENRAKKPRTLSNNKRIIKFLNRDMSNVWLSKPDACLLNVHFYCSYLVSSYLLFRINNCKFD